MRYLVLDCEAVAIGDVETYLEPVSAPANYKDPEKIAAYEKEAKVAQAAKAALDIDLARIVAIGWKCDGLTETLLAKDEVQERELLGKLWDAFFAGRRMDDWHVAVTFNGMGFDLPLLMRRSLYLGVAAPKLQLDRYKHPHVVDLMAMLSLDGRLKYHGLQFYANRFGIPVNDGISGSEIAQAVADGKWDLVQRHCASDVETTYALANRMGVL
jgi:DNA polymerase elongation subunit (family B)